LSANGIQAGALYQMHLGAFQQVLLDIFPPTAAGLDEPGPKPSNTEAEWSGSQCAPAPNTRCRSVILGVRAIHLTI